MPAARRPRSAIGLRRVTPFGRQPERVLDRARRSAAVSGGRIPALPVVYGLQHFPRTEVLDGFTRTYAYTIQTAKGKFDGSAQEKDGKLHFVGSVTATRRPNEIWNAIKTIPSWREDVIADIKVVAPAGGAASAAAAAKTYTVKAGDTLSGIAKAQLGSAGDLT